MFSGASTPKPQAHDLSQSLPGRVGNLTVAQQHCLEKLKKALQEGGHFVPERHDDMTLLRFLRARKFDLEKAKEMLIAAETWRKSFGVDELVKNFDYKEQPEVNKYYPKYYHKVDKEGRPVYIENLGKLDVKALYDITTEERQLQYHVLCYEKLLTERFPACSASAGYPVETSCSILDLDGVGLGQFWKIKDYVFKASAIGQDRYPETMGKFYIINAPYLFGTIWSFIKPWLDEVTVSKVSILGKDYKQSLLEQISPENLPRHLGGTCECVGGCSLSDAGPWNMQACQVNGVGNAGHADA